MIGFQQTLYEVQEGAPEGAVTIIAVVMEGILRREVDAVLSTLDGSAVGM